MVSYKDYDNKLSSLILNYSYSIPQSFVLLVIKLICILQLQKDATTVTLAAAWHDLRLAGI